MRRSFLSIPLFIFCAGCAAKLDAPPSSQPVPRGEERADKKLLADEPDKPDRDDGELAKLRAENARLRSELSALHGKDKTPSDAKVKREGLVLLKNSIKKIDKDGYFVLEGIVDNRTNLKFGRVVVSFTCFDKDGFHVVDIGDTASSLDPKDRWKFQTGKLKSNVASWKFDYLEGYKAGEFFSTAHRGKQE